MRNPYLSDDSSQSNTPEAPPLAPVRPSLAKQIRNQMFAFVAGGVVAYAAKHGVHMDETIVVTLLGSVYGAVYKFLDHLV